MSSPARIAVIVNSRAGTAAGHPRIAAEVTELFRAAGSDVDVIEPREGEDLTTVAREASARATIVTAAGGDGTVKGVAAGLVHSQAALGVLPLGTLNHFARDLHIPFDLPKAVAIVAAGRIGCVDVGEVNGAVFLNNSSIGLYPSIVEEREALRRRGHRKWPAMAIATAHVVARYRGVTVTTEVDGVRRTWRTPFVFIGNNAYQIDGVHLGERARLDEGTLFVYLAPRLRAHQLPILLAKALVGHARRSGDFEIVPAAELWIGTAKVRRQRVALDGEIESMNTPLHYRTRPKALRVVVPAG
jgi:diacylglycerol kinase family enzyme